MDKLPRQMPNKRYPLAICLALIGFSGIGMSSNKASAAIETGAKGADIYCYMRRSGNNHEVSWKASYALIKRQANSLFKTSPQHAAVMITEAVVKEPERYPKCGRFLGDLFGGENNLDISNTTEGNKQEKGRYDY